LRALAGHYSVLAHCCHGDGPSQIDGIPVRTFKGRRIAFSLASKFETSADRVIYDFPGTARLSQISILKAKPYAVWIHGWEVWGDMRKDYKRAIHGASLLLVNSQYTLSRAAENLPRDVQTIVCPLGTDDDEMPDHIGPASGVPTLLLVGRIDELMAKGHDLLIEIWPMVVQAVPGARLVMVGGGSHVDVVRAMADRSAAREFIEVAGFVSDRELESYWARAWAFAMLGYAEGFGLVYIEAMRRGLPVIASREDAGQETNVDGVTGFNISRADKTSLTETAIALLGNPELCTSIGKKGHEHWNKHYRYSCFQERLLTATAGFLA